MFVVGTVFWLAHTGFELGYSPLAEEWEKATEPDKKTRLLVASGIRDIDEGLIAMGVVAYAAGLLLIGIGMAVSAIYPRWFGWVFIVLGALVVVLGPAASVTGNNAILFPMIILTALTYLWMLVPGVWITRKAW